MKYKGIFGALMVLSLLISCKTKIKEQAMPEKQSIFVEVIVAGAEDVPSSLEVNGTVLSNEMVELHPEISGRLVYLNLPDGATVKQGTLLARINDADCFWTRCKYTGCAWAHTIDVCNIDGKRHKNLDHSWSQRTTFRL